ncbi:unnamed protein product [Cunninghamella echinulata]
MNQQKQQQSNNDNMIHNPTLIEEQLARNQAFLGEEGLSQVRNACVIVIGVGSIGSWAALMLARSGVQHLRLIDPSVLKPKDISSHAAASTTTLGQHKTKALQHMVAQFAPFVTIEPIIDTWQPKYISLPSSSSKIMVVDCLNHSSLDRKIELIKYCHSRQIPLVSALDPGNKVDPTCVQITDISDSFGDPSAKYIRRRLKLLGIDRNLPVVYSIEKPIDPKYIQDNKRIVSIKDDENLLKSPDTFKEQKKPILGTIAGMFGMSLTTYTLLQLANFSAYALPDLKLRDKLYTRIHQDFRKREQQHFPQDTFSFDIKDIEYMYEEIWYGKSVISGPQERITLVRWDKSKPLSYVNTVCMSKEESRAHDKLPIDTNLRQHYGDDVVDFIEKQLDEQARFEKIPKYL